jgi:hypothetical protein
VTRLTGMAIDADASLHIVVSPPRTRSAARCAARYVMLNPHGCTGPGCASDAHGTARAHLHAALDALGLRRVT